MKILNTLKITAVLFTALLLFGCDNSSPEKIAEEFSAKAITCHVDFYGQSNFSGTYSGADPGNGTFTVESPESIKGTVFDYKNYVLSVTFEQMTYKGKIPFDSPVYGFLQCIDQFRKGNFKSDSPKAYYGKAPCGAFRFTAGQRGFISEITLTDINYTLRISDIQINN